MMQAQEIIFSDAQGLVADFISDGVLDLQAFLESSALNQLQGIAKEHMQVEDIEQEPKLKQALLSAYRLGLKSVK